jgi:hypothetical protein
MTQAFDMKRLHMGCGESLQSHLPLFIFGKPLLSSRGRGQLTRLAGVTAAIKKITRDESR